MPESKSQTIRSLRMSVWDQTFLPVMDFQISNELEYFDRIRISICSSQYELLNALK